MLELLIAFRWHNIISHFESFAIFIPYASQKRCLHFYRLQVLNYQNSLKAANHKLRVLQSRKHNITQADLESR